MWLWPAKLFELSKNYLGGLLPPTARTPGHPPAPKLHRAPLKTLRRGSVGFGACRLRSARPVAPVLYCEFGWEEGKPRGYAPPGASPKSLTYNLHTQCLFRCAAAAYNYHCHFSYFHYFVAVRLSSYPQIHSHKQRLPAPNNRCSF